MKKLINIPLTDFKSLRKVAMKESPTKKHKRTPKKLHQVQKLKSARPNKFIYGQQALDEPEKVEAKKNRSSKAFTAMNMKSKRLRSRKRTRK